MNLLVLIYEQIKIKDNQNNEPKYYFRKERKRKQEDFDKLEINDKFW